jgi:hypothetical protein
MGTGTISTRPAGSLSGRPAGVTLIERVKRRDTDRLRHVVECLPYDTRVAMLQGLQRYDRIIVGAYSDRSGGVCPMLAAHRCGGRTDFRSFARAWDRFTGAGRRARKASEREVRTLMAQIEASIWREDEMRAEVASLATGTPVTPERETATPKREQGGAWLRPFRRWDGYREAVAAALRQLHARESVGSHTSAAEPGGEEHEEREEREPEVAGR